MAARSTTLTNPMAGKTGVQSAVLADTSATRIGRGGSCMMLLVDLDLDAEARYLIKGCEVLVKLMEPILSLILERRMFGLDWWLNNAF
jgi:hypothetical protein